MSEFIIGTCNYNTIKATCEDAQKNSKMISIIGYPGAGKTTALEWFSSENELTYYVRVEPSMNARHFYQRILQSIGVQGKDIGKDLHEMINDIAYRLNYNPNKKLLIVDEAGKFKTKFLEYLHEIRDKTNTTTGIILAGPEYFHDNLMKWKNQGVIGVPELYRRINHWEYLSRPTFPEAKRLCEVIGLTDLDTIKKIFETSDNFAEIRYKAENAIRKQNPPESEGSIV